MGKRNKRKKQNAQSKPKQKANPAAKGKTTVTHANRHSMQLAVFTLCTASGIGLVIFGVIYSSHKIGAIWFLFFPSVLIALIAGCLQWHVLVSAPPPTHMNDQQPNETTTSGLLVPADEPTPPNPCGLIPGDAMLVILGNSASWGTAFPQTIIKIGNDKMLTMDEIAGRIAISGKFFSRDGKIVAELKDNEFYINPNNYFRKKRPDTHSLVVYDQESTEVLNVRFINAHTIKFTGVIRHPRATVVISETQGLFRNTICTGEPKTAHYAFDR